MRLPLKFEQEVLKKHRIEWDDVVGYMTRGYNSSYDDYIIHDTERYELAGIALEYLVHNGWDILNGGIKLLCQDNGSRKLTSLSTQ